MNVTAPGYEGEAFIEVDGCENYKVFKEWSRKYDNFYYLVVMCTVKYGGNRQ